MKWNIKINQLVLSKTILDLTDAAILDYLCSICSSKSRKVEKRRKWGHTWIQYKHLISEMPLLRIKSTGAITPRMHKIEKEGFIKIIKEKGNRLYIVLTEKVDTLFIKSNMAVSSPVHGTKQPPIQQTKHDNYIKEDNTYASFSVMASPEEPFDRKKWWRHLRRGNWRGETYKGRHIVTKKDGTKWVVRALITPPYKISWTPLEEEKKRWTEIMNRPIPKEELEGYKNL